MSPRAERLLFLFVVLNCVAALALTAGGDFPGMAGARAFLAFFLLGWFPGYAVLRLLRGEPDPGDLAWRLGAPLALAPIISTTIIILAALAGASLRAASFLSVGVAILLYLLPARPAAAGRAAQDAGPGVAGAGGPPASAKGALLPIDPPAAAPRENLGIGGLALASAIVVALVFIVNPWLNYRGDSRFHIGVVREVLRGGLPPMDPYFAGMKLQYMWFYHAYVSGLKALSGASIAGLLAGINPLMLLAFILLIWQTVRGLGRSHREALLAAVLVVFAMGGLSWAFQPVKMLQAFTGADRGLQAMGYDRLWPPNIRYVGGLFVVWLDQPFLLRKFLIATAVSMELAVFFLHLETCRRAVFGAGFGNAVLVALAAAGMLVLHPLVALPAMAAVCGAAIGLALWQRWRPLLDGGVGVGRVAGLVAANAAGGVLSLPYLLQVTAGKETAAGLPVSFVPIKIISLVVGAIGVLLPALPWLWRVVVRDRRPKRADAWIAAWALALLAVTFFYRFPQEGQNIDKANVLGHLPLALVAGWVLAEMWARGDARRRRLVKWYLAALLIPVNVILLGAYLMDPDARNYLPHEREALAFMDRTIPDNALVFDSEDRDIQMVDLQRRMYWGRGDLALLQEYPKEEMDARRSLRDALYAPEGPDSAAVGRLRALGPPVYILVRAGHAVPGSPPARFAGGQPREIETFAAGGVDPLAAAPAFQRLFDSADVRVYRLR